MFRWCWPIRKVGYTQTRTILDAPAVVVTPCYDADGEIRVLAPPESMLPIRAYWRGSRENIIEHSYDTLRATHLCPGQYSVHVVDAAGRISGATHVSVNAAEIPTVVGYRTQDASSDTARDGMVVALCSNVDVQKASFWWSNGACTQGPTLSMVRPGRYAALIVSVHDTALPRCLHACAPAHVDVEMASPDGDNHAPAESSAA